MFTMLCIYIYACYISSASTRQQLTCCAKPWVAENAMKTAMRCDAWTAAASGTSCVCHVVFVWILKAMYLVFHVLLAVSTHLNSNQAGESSQVLNEQKGLKLWSVNNLTSHHQPISKLVDSDGCRCILIAASHDRKNFLTTWSGFHRGSHGPFLLERAVVRGGSHPWFQAGCKQKEPNRPWIFGFVQVWLATQKGQTSSST